MNTTKILAAMAAQLDALLPFGHSIELNVRRYAHPPDICVDIHGVASYAEAQGIFRTLGIQKREKSVYSDLKPRTVLNGKLTDTILVTVYCSGLPPSCRLETFKERVPKTQTVDVGEFVEVERTRVVCGHEQPQPVIAEQENVA